jgi:hypothetical protein
LPSKVHLIGAKEWLSTDRLVRLGMGIADAKGTAGDVRLGDGGTQKDMHTILFRHRLEVAIRYFWYKFKLLIRQNVNVDKNFFVGDAAVRFANGTLPKGTRITCGGRTDGLGMQALARMSGMNFAKAFGATYVDTPFRRMGHAPGEMADWLKSWEDLFNFGAGEERINSGNYKVINYPEYLANENILEENVVLRFQQCYWLNRRYPDTFNAVASSFRDKIGLSPYRDANDEIAVAVHIRRGDVSAKKNASRFTPNSKILKSIACLEQISRNLNRKFVFSVYSQGNPSDFAEFAEIGCQLHIDSDAIWTMRKLVEADMLIMSKSSFSFVAAVINRGVKVYEHSFNPPLSDWIAKRPDGSFDQDLAELKLKDYLARASSPEFEPALARASG